MKILVVDDEPSVRSLVKDLLGDAGYHVLAAPDGPQGLDLLHKLRPDLIVLDIMLPGMSGIDVVREIMQDSTLRDTPILIISGCVPEPDANALLGELRVASYLSKVELSTSLVSRVQEILSKQAQDEIKPGSGADSIGNIEHKKTILVADDEPSILEVARQLLTPAGHNVLTAKDGRQALALAREEQPALIVLDLVMPGISGIDVVRKIRNDPRLKNTPILIISGYVPEPGANNLLRNLRVAGYLSKMELATSLVSRVQEILSEQTQRVA